MIAPRPELLVLAGVNGAGKSSLGGATLRGAGADYFNPDEVARRIRDLAPQLGQREANALAWREGLRLLERAIAQRLDYAFETTLGGATIPRLVAEAAARGFALRLWYIGLESVERHCARVAARVARGGHDIPEADIRRRFDASRRNLIRLLPAVSALRLFDNSHEADPAAGLVPKPRLLLELAAGKARLKVPAADLPEWAKPVVAAALKCAGGPAH